MANNHTSLATKYRPQDWNDVSGQESVVNILRNQVETGTFRQSYLFTGKYGGGKAIAMDADILGPDGYFKMRDAKVGMKVWGEDGKLHNIIGAFPQGVKEMYRIYFSDNTFAECCIDHLWTMRQQSCRITEGPHQWFTASTRWLLQQDLWTPYREDENGHKNNSRKFKIPVNRPLDMPKSELPIHPYLLGQLLADGSISKSAGSLGITISDEDVRDRVNELLRNVGVELAQTSNIDSTNGLDYYLRNYNSDNGIAKLKQQLDSLNLRCKSVDKHIPHMYLFASIEQRLQLLQGLFDGDGSIQTGQYTYSTSSEKIYNGIKFLIQSLGGVVYVKDGKQFFRTLEDGSREYHGLNWEFCFHLPKDILPFTSNKHKSRYGVGSYYDKPIMYKFIDRIEKIEDAECQCIMTDNPTGLFLIKDCIVTHNTTCARILAKSINGTEHDIYEVDAATHNGVDHVRAIAEDERRKPLVGKYKIYILDECFSGDAEVLTDEGFKAFKDLKKTEKIAQYNEDGTIEFVKPTRFINRHHEGSMVKLWIHTKPSFSYTGDSDEPRYEPKPDDKYILMTPNHIQPVVTTERGNRKILKNTISSTDFCYKTEVIVSGKGVDTKYSFNEFDEVFIAMKVRGISSDYQNWKIPFLSHFDIDESNFQNQFEAILKSLSIPYEVTEGPVDIRNCPLKANAKFVEFRTAEPMPENLNELIDISRLNEDYAFTVLHKIIEWDLNLAVYPLENSRVKGIIYPNDDNDVLNFVSSIAPLCGLGANIIPSKKEIYLKEKETKPSKSFLKQLIPYSGEVYCVEVPSHMIIVRAKGYVFVSGNCHLTSPSAWGAWLKLLEEPPATAINIFATTNPEKVPNTILSRVQRYDFTNIPRKQIYDRLKYIAGKEEINIDDPSLQYIAKAADGGMRDAISMLDKCSSLGKDITMKEVSERLALADYSINFDLMEALLKKDAKNSVKLINDVYERGLDIRKFIQSFMWFVCDVCNYFVFNSFQYISIPELPEYKTRINNISQSDALLLLQWCKFLNSLIQRESNPKNLIIVEALLWTNRK